MSDIYQTGLYEEKNPTWHEEDAPWKAAQVEGILRTNSVPCGTICEVGCGTGEILLNLARSFPNSRLSGYEVSPQAFARSSRKQSERVKFFLSDALDETGQLFDVVLVIDVIEHVDDYIGFVRKVRSLGRYKIFHIPLDLSLQSLARTWPIMRLRRDVGHLHYFFKESALATLTECGYKIVDWRYTASRLELSNQALTSRLMKVPRRLMYAINSDLAVRVLGGYSLLVLAE